MHVIVLSILISPLLLNCNSYKILAVFPTPMHSHYTLTSKLVNELAKRNHEVTFVTPFPREKSSDHITELSLQSVVDAMNEQRRHLLSLENQNLINQVSFLTNMGCIITEKTLENRNVQDLLLSNKTFDLIMLPEFLTTGLLGIGYHFKSPVILFSTMPLFSWSPFRLGHPSLPSYAPNILVGYGGKMNFWKRFINTISEFYSILYYQLVALPKHAEIVKRNIPGSPDLYQFLNNESLLLINSHMSSFEAAPQIPNVIEIGGFHVEEPKPLPEDLQAFLDASIQGVVVFSLGTNLKSSDMPREKVEAIIQAFAELKQNVLWKWENDDLPGKPPNVKIMKWFPQCDVLAHRNVRAFISHGGLLSTMESIYHAVPIIGIPVFADQKMNIRFATAYGYAVTLSLQTLTKDELLFALKKVLHDEEIKSNAKKRSSIMRDQPLKPLDVAVYWIEYVARYQGAPHLKYSGANLNWFQRQLVDVVIFVCVNLLIFIFVIRILLKKIYKCICKDHRRLKKD